MSCSCPAWRNQGRAAHQRSCKHIIGLRGQQAEKERLEAAGVDGQAARVSSTPSTSTAKKDTAPPILLAHSWDQLVDLTGWWMSEKLDGVRAYWDGKNLVSRLGNAFVAPKWFLEGLPDHPLDGELWGGRKKFQRTVSIVRRQDASEQWKGIQYVVFDAPSLALPFEERLERCRQTLPLSERLEVLAHQPCEGVEHLRAELQRVEGMGGEGLMLRQPGSLYEVGRSWTLLKVKTFQDAEAIVVGHQPGAGRHAGRLGALLVRLPDGTQFSVGTGFSDAERESPPPLGSLITFRYQELSDGGVPRFPTYVGVRFDLEAPSLQTAAPSPLPSKPAPAKPKAAPAAPTEGARRFEFVEGTSSKFWEVALAGAEQTVRYGRIGTSGQCKVKSFSSAEAAQRDTDKLIAEKTGKGYQEV